MSPSSLLSTPIVTTLFARTPPPPLPAKKIWRSELTREIDALDASINIRAVLHLLNDDFNGCHELAQTQEGNLYSNHLHAIVHRREPDYWNSKYWIARTTHARMPDIYTFGDVKPTSISRAQRAAEQFVDQVQAASQGGNTVELQKQQWEEMTKLAKVIIEVEG